MDRYLLLGRAVHLLLRGWALQFRDQLAREHRVRHYNRWRFSWEG
jgi:hypothetical protein